MPQEDPVPGEAIAIAAFTLLQALIEKLTEHTVLSHQDVQEIVRKSIDANMDLFQQDRGRLNHQAADLLHLIMQRVELGWPHHPTTEHSP